MIARPKNSDRAELELRLRQVFNAVVPIPDQEWRYFWPQVRERRFAYVGEYVISPTVAARVFSFEGRLFANVSGMGEAELLGLSAAEFTIMPIPGSRIRFERDSTGRVSRFAASIGGQNLLGTRR